MIEDSIHQRLVRGEIVSVGGKLFALCRVCHSIIRIDKPILGSLHFCTKEGGP